MHREKKLPSNCNFCPFRFDMKMDGYFPKQRANNVARCGNLLLCLIKVSYRAYTSIDEFYIKYMLG